MYLCCYADTIAWSAQLAFKSLLNVDGSIPSARSPVLLQLASPPADPSPARPSDRRRLPYTTRRARNTWLTSAPDAQSRTATTLHAPPHQSTFGRRQSAADREGHPAARAIARVPPSTSRIKLPRIKVVVISSPDRSTGSSTDFRPSRVVRPFKERAGVLRPEASSQARRRRTITTF